MKYMRTGSIKAPMIPLFYLMDIKTGTRMRGKPCGLEKAINKADKVGSRAYVYKLGTCTRPVHIGGYE